jgi:hypothetical protein
MKTQFKKGDRVMINPENDNENYNKYRKFVLIITHVATNKDEHPGYDNGMKGSALYDFKTNKGMNVPFSLYDYEIVKV